MSRKQYWWIIARDESGKPYLIFGSAESEDDARRKGLEMLPMSDFQIRMFPTRNTSEASAQFRGKRLESGEGLERAKERIGHEKSVNRLRYRESRVRRYSSKLPST